MLASRMIFGGLLFSHGIAKWSNFDTMSTMFPDPLGIGSSASLSLAIFGEVSVLWDLSSVRFTGWH